MGVLRAGFNGTVGQPSAQVIDGSLKFAGGTTGSSNQYLEHTFSSNGNRRTFTMSFWLKRSDVEAYPGIFFCGSSSVDPNNLHMYFNGDTLLLYSLKDNSNVRSYNTTQQFRDTSSWYHIVVAVDSTISSPALDRFKVYVNGDRVTEFSSSNHNAVDQNTEFTVNQSGKKLEIGLLRNSSGALSYTYNGNMSQWYFIDGLQLGPENFGFTDPLTNTWRPKKYTGSVNAPVSGFGGTVWSSYVTNGSTGGTAPSKAFNGDIANNSGYSETNWTRSASNGNTPAVFDVSGVASMADVTEVKVYAYVADSQNNGTILAVNDVNQATSGQSGFQVYTVDVTGNGLDTIKYKYVDGNGPYCYLTGVTVSINGGAHQELIDGSGAPAGVNGFYLPMDGNSPIGQDKSGNGKDFTPVNFGGSNSVDKATGALPILEGAGGAIANVGVRTDAYASNLVLALPLVGNANDVSNQINSGSTAKTVTSNGNAGASSDTSNFYNGSFEFDGTDDALRTDASSDLTLGTGAFTIECWFNRNNITDGYTVLISDNIYNISGGWSLYTYQDDIEFWKGGSQIFSVSTVIVAQTWMHIAVQRDDSGNWSCYINGIDQGVSASDSINFTNNRICIGANNYNGNYPAYDYNGYIQDVRIYKGVAKYTSNFIPASANPDILPDTPSGVSGGSKLTKITTDGAVSFDGTGDYLTVPYSSDFVLDGDFTIECFVYFISGSVMVDFARSGSYANSWQLYNQTPTFYGYSSSGNAYMTSNTPLSRGWNHLVVTRTISNNTARMFINGVQTASSTSFSHTYGNDTSNVLMVGAQSYSGPTAYFTGHISNLRIIKGTALYTSNFTPPSAPLTNVTNTKLLCCQSNTSATAAVVVPDDVNEPFSGAGGAEGGGTTSDYLQVSSSGHSDFSLDGDFTVEWWHYRAAANANNGFMWTIGDSKTSTGLELYWGSSGSTLKLYTNDGSNNTSATAATGWHHYAVVRNSGTIKVYYDGTEVGSVSNSNTFSGDVRIGAEYYNGSITGGMHGPMSQFRFVKGTAVYTSNFTAPTTTLTAITNTKLLTLQGSTITDASGTSKTITVNGTVTTVGIVRNGNAAATNFNPFNTDINTVRGQESGYPTMNPLAKNSAITLKDGNLRITQTDSHGQKKIVYSNAKIPNGGKWYVEWIMGGGGACTLGIGKNGKVEFRGTDTQIGTDTNSWGYEPQGNLFHNGNQGGSFGSCAAGDVIGMTIDTSGATLTIQWHKNGVLIRNSSGTICQFTGISLDEDYVVMMSHHTPQYDTLVNFGQKPFNFPPPDGFQPLNAANLRPETVITRPDKFVNTTLWSGNNADPREIDCGHQPDLIWVKTRNQTNWNWLSDSVRGTADKRYKIYSNSDSAEDTAPIYGQADSFVSNGWIAGGGTDGSNPLSDSNQSGTNYVCWSWKAGGNKGTFNVDDTGHQHYLQSPMGASTPVYSGYCSGTEYSSTYSYEKAFDGSTSTASYASNGNTITFTPPGGIANSGNILVTFDNGSVTDGGGSADFQINGSSVKSFFQTAITADGGGSGSSRVATITGITNITSMSWSRVADNDLFGVRKIVINGSETLTDGATIAPIGMSVGTKQGFSIIKYQANSTAGATIPHGLSQAPTFVLVKSLETAGSANSDWTVFHSTLSGTNAVYLNETSASAATGSWNDTNPDANVITLGTAHVSNLSPNHYIAYAWHDVVGLQKFGSFEGNGATDGPFVELGFEPAVILTKNIDNYGTNYDWCIYDNTRSTFNPNDKFLCPNLNKQENVRGDGNTDNSRYVDFLSNGFKIRNNSSPVNLNAHTIIYAAWAAAPAVNLYGGQSNAR